jgi:hypothetical protein
MHLIRKLPRIERRELLVDDTLETAAGGRFSETPMAAQGRLLPLSPSG